MSFLLLPQHPFISSMKSEAVWMSVGFCSFPTILCMSACLCLLVDTHIEESKSRFLSPLASCEHSISLLLDNITQFLWYALVKLFLGVKLFFLDCYHEVNNDIFCYLTRDQNILCIYCIVNEKCVCKMCQSHWKEGFMCILFIVCQSVFLFVIFSFSRKKNQNHLANVRSFHSLRNPSMHT